jgi:hypothetical protein
MAQTQTTSLSALRGNMPPAVPAAFETPPAISVGMDTVQGFEALQRIAKLFAASDIIPPSYKNIPNAVIAVDMAMRMGANPLMVMQNLYVVYNRPAWSAQFLIATLNKSGKFSALRYEFQGKEGEDNWGCRAVATELSTGEKLVGPLITIGLAKKEGWYGKKESKWQTIPELMLRYRSAAWFVRAYAPEIAMGLQTAEEVKDTFDLAPSTDGTYSVTLDDIQGSGASTVEQVQQDNPKSNGKLSPTEKREAARRGAQKAAAHIQADAKADPESYRDEPPAPAQEDQPAPQGQAEPELSEPAPSAPTYPIYCPNRERHIEEDECGNCSAKDGCPSWGV